MFKAFGETVGKAFVEAVTNYPKTAIITPMASISGAGTGCYFLYLNHREKQADKCADARRTLGKLKDQHPSPEDLKHEKYALEEIIRSRCKHC